MQGGKRSALKQSISLSLPLNLISRWGWEKNGWRWVIHETSFKLPFMFQCKEMFSFVEKLKKGLWINVQCIVISWYFVKFTQKKKKKLISPTKLSNLGMIKPSSPSEILSQRPVHPTKKILRIKNALLRRVWPSRQLFTFPLHSWDPHYQAYTSNIRETKRRTL